MQGVRLVGWSGDVCRGLVMHAAGMRPALVVRAAGMLSSLVMHAAGMLSGLWAGVLLRGMRFRRGGA
jgi:hypothetical protein